MIYKWLRFKIWFYTTFLRWTKKGHQLYGYQQEINRIVSQIREHQELMGETKLVTKEKEKS